jgi:SH3-like domain-containing protein
LANGASGCLASGLRRGPLLILAILIAQASGAVIAPVSASAERGWIRGEIKLNLRSGPGTQFRILGGVATGDGLTVLKRQESWTKVRTDEEIEGWIPVGFLKPEPPPTVRLAQAENEVLNLRQQLESITSESSAMRTTNAALAESDGAQRAEIERLILDNTKLRAGARYPELIAGASILAAGKILGAMLHTTAANKRPQSRIRL